MFFEVCCVLGFNQKLYEIAEYKRKIVILNFISKNEKEDIVLFYL